MLSEGLEVSSYHLQVPAFGDWGFHLASPEKLVKKHQLPDNTKFLSEDTLPSLFVFGKDEQRVDTEVNHLTKPMLIQYYNEAVREWE